MSKNWLKTCATLLSKSDSEEFSFDDERQALQMVEKNIYHKRPSMVVITFAIVSCVCVYQHWSPVDLW